MIAALFVEPCGVYSTLLDVDCWPAERDARTYAGPYPVVAHPPCARWSKLAPFCESRYGHLVGDDAGCFASALDAVRRWGGVLEHPAESRAWSAFGLPLPTRGAWSRSLFDPGWSTEVSQAAYGHRAPKRTWLYFVGPDAPPALDWSEPRTSNRVANMDISERIATPRAFALMLLDLAGSRAGVAGHV